MKNHSIVRTEPFATSTVVRITLVEYSADILKIYINILVKDILTKGMVFA